MRLKLNNEQKDLRKRLLTMLYQANTSHIGSCFSAIDIIEAVYKVKKKNEKFVLSYGHAAYAWYAILEKYNFIKKGDSKNLMVHPDRNPEIGIEVSTGSLGQGLPIALGMALAERKNLAYCLISDGECAEGSIWEALRIYEELKIYNLRIILAGNGYGAYDQINLEKLKKRIKGFGIKIKEIDGHNLIKLKRELDIWSKNKAFLLFAKCSSEQLPFLSGLNAHYHKMTEDDYILGLKLLCR